MSLVTVLVYRHSTLANGHSSQRTRDFLGEPGGTAVGALGRARAAAAGADHIPIPSDANSLAPPDWRFAFAIIR